MNKYPYQVAMYQGKQLITRYYETMSHTEAEKQAKEATRAYRKEWRYSNQIKFKAKRA